MKYYITKTVNLLQMSSLQYPVFRSKRLLQSEIELKQKDLDDHKLHINFENEKPLRVLEAMKTEKEEAQKNLFWFQCMTFYFENIFATNKL